MSKHCHWLAVIVEKDCNRNGHSEKFQFFWLTLFILLHWRKGLGFPSSLPQVLWVNIKKWIAINAIKKVAHLHLVKWCKFWHLLTGYSRTNTKLKGQCHAMIPLDFIYKKTRRDVYRKLLFNFSRPVDWDRQPFSLTLHKLGSTALHAEKR